jgi:hypothetical protein
MTLILNGDTGLSDVDGSASTPAIRGTDVNTGIYFPGADRIGFAEGGVQVGEFDASGNFQFNSGYGSTAIAYGCRAWVNFNGTGTVAIRASGNVTSITDNGTGDYTVNFTTSMPDANYAVAGQGQYDTTSTSTNNTGTSVSRTASAISASSARINTQATGTGALLDFLIVCVAIFR